MQIADVEDTTEGGLLMAGSSKEKPTLGTVKTSSLVCVQCFLCLHTSCSLLRCFSENPGVQYAQKDALCSVEVSP